MDATEVVASLSTPEGRADPYPLYAALHAIGPVIELGPRDLMVIGYDTINVACATLASASPTRPA